MEVSSRKRTRESLREKEKEKERETEREREKEERVKERDSKAKDRESLKETSVDTRKTPPKLDSTSSPPKPAKKQCKVDDILLKVTNRQTKYMQAKEKKALEETMQCNGKEEVRDVKNSPLSRRGRNKATVEALKMPQLTPESPSAKNRAESPVIPPPSLSPPPESSSPVQKEQPSVPESPSTKHSNSDNKSESVEDNGLPVPTETEVVSASSGEYEGGDEDDGEEEEVAAPPTPKLVTQSASPSMENPAKEPCEDEKVDNKDQEKDNDEISLQKTEAATDLSPVVDDDQTETLNECDKDSEIDKRPVCSPEASKSVPEPVASPKEEEVEKSENSVIPKKDDCESPPKEELVCEPPMDAKIDLSRPKTEPLLAEKKDTCVLVNATVMSEAEPLTPREKTLPTVEHQDTTLQLQNQTEELKQHSPESGKTTPHLENPGSVKRTPPSQPDLPSMGVYTPDSTTNSVHSLHYSQCDLDVSQLGLESPTSIASDLGPQNSVERPPSALPSIPPPTNVPISVSMQIATPVTSSVPVNMPQQVQYADCSMPQHTPPAHHPSIHPMHQPHTPQSLQQPRTPQSIPTQSPQPLPQSHTPQPLPQSHTPQSIPTHSPQPLPQSHTPQPLPQSHTPQPMQLSLAQQAQSQSMAHNQSQQTQSQQQQQQPAHQQQPQPQQQSQQTQQSQSHSKRASGSQTTHRSRSTQQSSRSHRATPPTSHTSQTSQHSVVTSQTSHSTVTHTAHVAVPPQYQQSPSSMSLPPAVPHPHSHTPHAAHSHNMAVISQGNYMAVAAGSQSFPTQNTYVIQHRSGRSGAPTPCTTATNFYIQTSAMPPHSHTPAPTPLSASGSHQTTNSCSLAKLQQLTNGLDMVPPTPPPAMNLTPPPPIPHTLTPPQTSRQLPTPPQVGPLGYAKNYYNVNTVPPGTPGPPGRSTSRSSANNMPSLTQSYPSESLYRQTLDPSGTCPQMQSAASRVSPNVALNTNLMAAAQYGYRVAQPATGYMNQAAQLGGFMNQASQLPVGVVNVPTPYPQDPHQQNPAAVYTTYHGYINGGLMQPLNSSMRPR